KTSGPAQSITATDVVTGSITATQSPIVINPAAAQRFIIDQFQSPTVAGGAHDVRVKAIDQFGNTDPTYAGTITFTSNDPLSHAPTELPANYTFTGSGLGKDNGVHTFINGVILKSAGTRQITANDTVTAAINGSEIGITVSAASATH